MSSSTNDGKYDDDTSLVKFINILQRLILTGKDRKDIILSPLLASQILNVFSSTTVPMYQEKKNEC